jgi:hypothetical protein
MTDTPRDIFALWIDDIVFTYPKWGTARGKEELGRSTRILTPMCKRYPMIQTLLTAWSNNGCVFIEGLRFGQLGRRRQLAGYRSFR